MSTGTRILAVQSLLNEIKNVSPVVSNTFLFNFDGEIVATDEGTSSLTGHHAAKTFKALDEKADVIGGLESVTFYGSNSRMSLSRTNDSYLATVASRESDPMMAETLARILVPTVLRVIDNFQVAPEQELAPEVEAPMILTGSAEPIEESSESVVEKPESAGSSTEAEQPESELEYEPSPTEPSATQFIVEHIGGLLVSSDTVRIDGNVISQWKEQYEDREISEVNVETLSGETTRCKFKPIKDSKLEGKGLIQMPQKIQSMLQTGQGELVMVKPAIE